jgi:hypothetical protein
VKIHIEMYNSGRLFLLVEIAMNFSAEGKDEIWSDLFLFLQHELAGAIDGDVHTFTMTNTVNHQSRKFRVMITTWWREEIEKYTVYADTFVVDQPHKYGMDPLWCKKSMEDTFEELAYMCRKLDTFVDFLKVMAKTFPVGWVD